GAGLLASTQSIAIRIDLTPPATTDTLVGDLGDNGWYRSNVTVSFNTTDALSGVAGIQYRIDSGAWVAYSAPFVLLDGQHVLDYYSTDWAGNPEPKHSKSFDIDTTDPLTFASVPIPSGQDGWYLSGLSVQLQASDTISGVTGIFYQVNGGDWQHYTAPFTIG